MKEQSGLNAAVTPSGCPDLAPLKRRGKVAWSIVADIDEELARRARAKGAE